MAERISVREIRALAETCREKGERAQEQAIQATNDYVHGYRCGRAQELLWVAKKLEALLAGSDTEGKGVA